MFKMWARCFADTRPIKEIVIEDSSEDTRTHKVFHALEQACIQFDLPQPIWLKSNQTAFKRHGKTRFKQDSFIETIEFDFLEIEMLEEDD